MPDRPDNSPPPQPPPEVISPISSRFQISFFPGVLMGLGFMTGFLVLRFSPLNSILWGVLGGVASWWIETSWNTEEEITPEAGSLPTDSKVEKNSLAENRTRGESWDKNKKDPSSISIGKIRLRP